MMIQSPISGTTKTLYRSLKEPVNPRPSTSNRLRTPSQIFVTNGSNGNAESNGTSRTHGTRKNHKKSSLWSPWKLMLLSIALGVVGSIYLTHVFQTQTILREVQQLRRNYERVQRVNTDARRNYDRMTGPVEVYRQAGQIGMINGGAADPVIISNQ